MSTDRLAQIGGKPPYRIAGIPPGIISADDWDVTDEALAFLAHADTLVNMTNAVRKQAGHEPGALDTAIREALARLDSQ